MVEIKAIILAAGQGIRLRCLTGQIPKCLFTIRGRSILERQIKVLKKKGIKDITLVIGTKGRVWNQKAYESIEKICVKNKIRTILNFDNDKTQNSYSLFLSTKKIKKAPILAIDGDLVFNRNFLNLACKSPHEALILVKKSGDLSEPGTRVIVGKNGKVIDIGRNIIPSTRCCYLHSGFIKIGLAHFNKFKKILSKKAYWSSELSHPLKEFADKYGFYAVEVNEGWININTPQELKKARQLWKDVSK